MSCHTSRIMFLQSEMNIIEKFLESYFDQWLRPTLANQSCADISPFSSLPTNQSSSRMDNWNGLLQPIQDTVIWANQIVQIWIPLSAYKWNNQGQGWALSLYKWVCPLPQGSTLLFYPGDCLFWICRLFSWMRFLLFYSLDEGLLLALGWRQQTSLDTT